nr:RNA-directed DNA polymerase, eukaryota [Tanacetum cinerariifolium]
MGPSEYKGILDDTCYVPICEDSSTLKDHSEILSYSNNDDTSSDDDDFEDIEFVEASLLDSELVSLEESSSSFPIHVADSDSFFKKSDTSLSYSDNSLPEFETFSDHTEEMRSGSTTAHANNSLPEYDSFRFEIEPDQERLTSIVMDNIFDDSTNDPLLEAVDLFFASDNSIPLGIENIDYDSEGDIHFLEELLSNDSIPLPENESSNFDHHDDPLFPRPPPEPPEDEVFIDFEPDTGVLTTKRLVYNPLALWVQLVKAIHGSEGGYDKKGCNTRGCGSNVRFSKDTWLGDGPLNRCYNRLFRLDCKEDCCILNQISNVEWSWDWNRHDLRGRNVDSLNLLLAEIGNANVGIGDDSWHWNLSDDGMFTVGVTRKHIDDFILSSMSPSTRWNKSLPRMVTIFVWRLLLDRLPHRVNLSSRGLEIPSIVCPVCKAVAETSDHIFYACDTTSNVWRQIRTWCDVGLPCFYSNMD